MKSGILKLTHGYDDICIKVEGLEAAVELAEVLLPYLFASEINVSYIAKAPETKWTKTETEANTQDNSITENEVVSNEDK